MTNNFQDAEQVFSLSSDNQHILLTISHLDKEAKPQQVVDMFKQSDFSEFKLDAEALKDALENFELQVKAQKAIDPHTTFVIAKRVDAELVIDVSEDLLEAKAKINSAHAGKHVDIQAVVDALKENNIKFGISKPAIMLLIKKARQAAPGVSFQIIIAKGICAKDGVNASFHSLVEAPKRKLDDVMKEEYGSVNFKEIENLLAVEPNTKLIRKIPCRKGNHGKTVTGEYIEFIEGIDVPFCINENTAICPDDDNLLIATAHGTPVKVNRGIIVEPMLILENIGASSGPVEHHGCLIIKGDIAPGSNINATGDISVMGLIESSTVTCGGNLYVSKGIIGEKIKEGSDAYTTQVTCEGTLFTNFVQFSKIITKSDLNITRQLVHSSISCAGFINVMDSSGKNGAIFGGFLSSQKGVNTVSLGAAAGIKTSIDLIGPYHQLLEQKKTIEEEIIELKEIVNHAVTAKQKVNLAPDGEYDKSVNKRLTLTIIDAKRQIVEHNENLNLAQSDIQQYMHNTKVTALKTIYSKVSVSIAEEVFRTKRQYGATTVHIKNFQLIAESYRG